MDLKYEAKKIEIERDEKAERLQNLCIVSKSEKIKRPIEQGIWWWKKFLCPKCGKQLEIEKYFIYKPYRDATGWHYKCDCDYEFAEIKLGMSY